MTEFTRDSTSPLGIVNLHVTFIDKLYSKTILTKFMMVYIPSLYIVIIGRLILNNLRALVLTYHMVMKFSMRANICEATQGNHASTPNDSLLLNKVLLEAPPIDPQDLAKSILYLELLESLIKVPLDKAQPDRTIRVEATPLEEKWVQLINFLRENVKVFVWSPRDISGINPNVTLHHLNISPKA